MENNKVNETIITLVTELTDVAISTQIETIRALIETTSSCRAKNFKFGVNNFARIKHIILQNSLLEAAMAFINNNIEQTITLVSNILLKGITDDTIIIDLYKALLLLLAAINSSEGQEYKITLNDEVITDTADKAKLIKIILTGKDTTGLVLTKVR